MSTLPAARHPERSMRHPERSEGSPPSSRRSLATLGMTWKTCKSFAMTTGLFLLAFSGWYFGKSTPPLLNQQTLMHQVDAIMTDLHFYEFDERGQLSKHMVAAKMEHMPFNNQFFLTQVILTHHQSENKTSMHTDALTYLPKTALAFTDSPVIFEQAEQRIESKGMQANLNTNQIKLNHARATIKPKDEA